MNAAYVTALAALAGSVVGGFTSLATTWLSQHTQARWQQLVRDRTKLETLYGKFIEEVSKLYADAFEHEGRELSKLVGAYSMISRMRILSSPHIVEHADAVVYALAETYLAPNKTLRDLPEMRKSGALDPLRQFSDACREELRRFGSA